MKLHRLEVQDFRGLRHGDVTFGPAVTVLHGPNELGKSTLAEAIRAALLVPTTSRAGDEYVTWGQDRPACVTLTFEHEGQLWKIEKRFGHRKQATLSNSASVETPRFRDVAHGNGAEGRIRELLAWGIAPPGGRGAGPRLESFLLTALLGRQGEVQEILASSLERDPDTTGKALVTKALGALDKDPIVLALVERLQERVGKVFTPSGRWKTSSDSPLVALQLGLKDKEAVLTRLREAEQQGRAIREAVVRRQDERMRWSAEVEAAAAALQTAQDQTARTEARAALESRIGELREQLADLDRQRAELELAKTRLASTERELADARHSEQAASDRLEATRLELQASAEHVARAEADSGQAARVRAEERGRRRAELDAQRAGLEARLKDVVAAEAVEAEAVRLQEQLAQASETARATGQAVVDAERGVAYANASATLARLLEQDRRASDAAASLAEARQREQESADRLDAARARLADAERQRDVAGHDSTIPEIADARADVEMLRAVEAHIALTELRSEIRRLEEFTALAGRQRSQAQTLRSQATDLEQRVTHRVLPTPERVAAWRSLERELEADAQQGPPATPSAMGPVVIGVAAGLATAAVAFLGLGLSLILAAAAGLVVSALVGVVVWLPRRRQADQLATQSELRQRRRDRWSQEVEPSLRTAGLSSLATFEAASAELAGMRADAQRLRADADAADSAAIDAEQQSGPLTDRRATLARLERDAPRGDANTLTSRAATFADDASAVRRRIDEVLQAMEATRVRHRTDADAEVHAAASHRDACQTAFDEAARATASATTALQLAGEACDAETLARVRLEVAEYERTSGAPPPVDDATTILEQAREHHTAAATTRDGIRVRLNEVQVSLEVHVSALGAGPAEARRHLEEAMAANARELDALETADDSGAGSQEALTQLRIAHGELTSRLEETRNGLTAAQHTRGELEASVLNISTDVATRAGALDVMDRAVLEAQLQTALGDPALSPVDQPHLDVDVAARALDLARRQLEQCTTDLNEATGQLRLITGHVGSERLAQQEDAVNLARAEVFECERTEQAARRLLTEVETVEAARATHLGRALGGPVTRAFRELTGERYGPVSFATDLRAEHIEASGEVRRLDALSVGTREQLATLLRLAIAGHLRTAVVLDDQLVHSDTGRLRWFGERLRASAAEHEHQVIVFTCRPGDYLTENDGSSATTIDLAQVTSR
ncbi:MAG TPA: AAA family ATPase [Luteitalea sp.]|nr:AAA family ATPase [Luteitalea sp.]